VPGAFEPLRIRPFRRLLVSYLLNEVGDMVGLVALALLVYGETGNAVATAGLFIALNVAPAFLSPLLTSRVDLLPVGRALPAIYALEAVVFVGLALFADSFVLVGVLALGLVDGTLAVTGRSLTRGAVGRLLQDPGQLRAGNGLLNVSFAVAGVGGAALGGVLTGELGASTALLIDAGSFAVIAMILSVTSGLPAPAKAVETTRRRFTAAVRYISGHPTIRMLVGGEALALLFFTLVVPVEVVYARETLDTTETGFGALLSAWSAGMLIGSLVFVAAKRRSLVFLVAASTGLIGIAYLGMSASRSLALACAFSVVGGTGNGFQWVSVITAIQQQTPPHLHTRVVGVLESLNRGVPAVGFLIGGALTALFSPPVAFIVAGVGVLLLAAAAATVSAPRLREPPLEMPEEPVVPAAPDRVGGPA
jgi:MFS family permease